MKSARPTCLALLLATLGCGDAHDAVSGGSSDGEGVEACTAMGCDDGLDVAFSLKTPGGYSFAIVADGTAITCLAALPLPPCGQGAATNCSDPNVGVGESGCALAPSQQSLENLFMLGVHPASVEISVKRDGAEIAHQAFTPDYQRLAPNGEECGPICEQATVTLTVAP